jgi:hypothetical protein
VSAAPRSARRYGWRGAGSTSEPTRASCCYVSLRTRTVHRCQRPRSCS